MDDFLDPFLSSSSWPDMNESERPPWVGTAASKENGLPVDPMGAYEGDDKNPPICMIPSSHIMGKLATHESHMHLQDATSSIFVGGNLKYGLNKGFFTGENQQRQEIPNHISVPPEHDNVTQERSFSLQGVSESNLTAGSFAPELNTSSSVTMSHSALTESGSIESNGSEPSIFPQSLGDSHSISAAPPSWSPSYSGVSTVAMGQGKLQGFGLQGEFLDNDADILGKRCIMNDKLPLLDSFLTAVNGLSELHNPLQLPSFTAESQINLTRSASFQPHQQGQNELPNPHLPFAAGQQRTLNGICDLQTHQQLSQSTEGNSIKHYANHSPIAHSQPAQANGGSSNGAVKPRVRARRGQATDPHSIAERLRREKIAERMKNLQELVPNSNKSDKASMLDEIIDYVKFLQLQVKVLSMSRLGAAGAVVPLIADVQPEGSSSLLLSSTVGQGGADLSKSPDNLAFEQEVVKLMESNITTAMQYLQNKGLCLMPIALAAAISGRKGTSGSIPPDRKKPDMTQGVFSQNSKSMTKERNDRKDVPNGCNGAVVKQEAPKSVCNMRVETQGTERS